MSDLNPPVLGITDLAEHKLNALLFVHNNPPYERDSVSYGTLRYKGLSSVASVHTL